MSRWGAYFFPAFVLVFLTWAAISAFVILNRVFYDLRRRSVHAAQNKLEAANLMPVSGAGDRKKIESMLAGLSRGTIERLAADSKTPHRQAEIFAAYALEQWGAKRLMKASAGHRGERQKWARIAALRILTLSGYREAIHCLEEALNARTPDVVGAAVILLGRVGDEKAARMLTEALRKNVYSASRIATQLDRILLPIPHLLRPLLSDPLPVVRFWGATLLARYAGGEEINREVADLARDADANVRKAAVETLGKAGGPHAAETAVGLIGDPVWYVRAHAARALGDLRRGDLCEVVTPLLADREWWVRIAAKESLQAMGDEAQRALILCLDSPDLFARNGAAEVLQNIGILDRLIAGTTEVHKSDPDRIPLIRKIMAAGGPGLFQATMDRVGSNFDPAVLRLLDEAGSERPLSA